MVHFEESDQIFNVAKLNRLLKWVSHNKCIIGVCGRILT